MMNIFGSKKTVTVAELLGREKVCAIMNLPNHESLVAASLFKQAVEKDQGIEHEPTQVILSDIRDPLPKAQSYFWFGCGSRAQLSEYYKNQIAKNDLDAIMEASVFISGDELVHQTGVMLQSNNRKAASLFRWSVVSAAFHSLPDQEAERESGRVVQYYNLIDYCYRSYKENVDFVDYDDFAAEASQATMEEFAKQHQKLNKVLGRKAREYMVAGVSFFQINMLDETVYAILRRIALGNNKAIHISMGSYGAITYTNKCINPEVLPNISTLVIQPAQ